MPAYILPNHPGKGRGLLCLADLNIWERQNIPYIQSKSGRDLYFALASAMLLQDNETTPSLKTLVLGLTNRTMRQRIREFEDYGLIIIIQSETDARSRVIKPTQKLLDLFDAHTGEMRSIFQQRFAYTPIPMRG